MQLQRGRRPPSCRLEASTVKTWYGLPPSAAVMAAESSRSKTRWVEGWMTLSLMFFIFLIYHSSDQMYTAKVETLFQRCGTHEQRKIVHLLPNLAISQLVKDETRCCSTTVDTNLHSYDLVVVLHVHGVEKFAMGSVFHILNLHSI